MSFPQYNNEPPLLLTGGIIHTMAETGVSPEALLIINGKVAAHGSVAELEPRLGANGRKLDVQGATIMPGFIDTHPHLLHFSARSDALVDLTDAVDHDDIVQRIAERAKITPPGQWIVTTPVGEPYYFIRRSYKDLAERQLPNRHVLDKATDQHPVYIQAWAPRTPNVCAFNTMALRQLALTDMLPDRVSDVWIDKDDEGSLTGILRGSVNNSLYSFDPFWTQVFTKIPPLPIDPMRTTVKAMQDYNRLGVTTVYEAHNMTADHIQVYKKLREECLLSVRVMAAMEIEAYAMSPYQPLTMVELEQQMDVARSLQVEGDDYLCVRGASLSEGGACWTGHHRSFEPYRGPHGGMTKGMRFISQDKKKAFVEYCLKHGMRANFCCGSPGDHEDFLCIAEELDKDEEIASANWIIQHAAEISPQQTARLHKLGFDVTTSMSFSWGLGDIMVERIGAHVTKDLIPLNRYLKMGMKVGAGTDWGPKNLFEHMKLAETHEFAVSGYRNDTPDHKVTREQAVAMWTREAAKVLQWEGLGTLSVGSMGDVVIVDRDPLNCPLEELATADVLMTIVGGKVVYQKDNS